MLTKSTVSFNDLLDLIGNFDVVIEMNNSISYNKYRSWHDYNDAVNRSVKKVESEILDNLLYLEEELKIVSYVRWITHRLDQKLLSIDYIELALVVKDSQENKTVNPMLVDYVSDILVEERGTLSVPEDMEIVPENFASSIGDFLRIASKAALHIIQFLSNEVADKE